MHRKVNWNCDQLILWQQIANFKFSQKFFFSQINYLSLSQNRIGEILSNQPEFMLKRFLVKRASFQIPGACAHFLISQSYYRFRKKFLFSFFDKKKFFSQIDHLSLSQNRISEILSNQPEFMLKRFLVKRASFQIPGACAHFLISQSYYRSRKKFLFSFSSNFLLSNPIFLRKISEIIPMVV